MDSLLGFNSFSLEGCLNFHSEIELPFGVLLVIFKAIKTLLVLSEFDLTFIFFETGSYYAAQAGLDYMILSLKPLEYYHCSLQ